MEKVLLDKTKRDKYALIGWGSFAELCWVFAIIAYVMVVNAFGAKSAIESSMFLVVIAACLAREYLCKEHLNNRAKYLVCYGIVSVFFMALSFFIEGPTSYVLLIIVWAGVYGLWLPKTMNLVFGYVAPYDDSKLHILYNSFVAFVIGLASFLILIMAPL